MAHNPPYTFVIDLSDTRNKYIYEALEEAGYTVFVYGTGDWVNKSGTRLVFLFAPPFVLCGEVVEGIPSGSFVFCTRVDKVLAL